VAGKGRIAIQEFRIRRKSSFERVEQAATEGRAGALEHESMESLRQNCRSDWLAIKMPLIRLTFRALRVTHGAVRNR